MFETIYSLSYAVSDYSKHKTLGPAAKLLLNFAMLVNKTTPKGWEEWRAARKAAEKLMTLLSESHKFTEQYCGDLPTEEEVRCTFEPIRKFLVDYAEYLKGGLEFPF